MERFVWLVTLFCLILQSCQSEYRAVVMEYTPNVFTDINIKYYERYIETASKVYSADIVIFPEATLTVMRGNGSPVPNPEDNVIPYKNDTYEKYKVISKISQAAARYRIYVVVNFYERVDCDSTTRDCPERGFFIYNTNVAFNRNGTVVARYRKYNLYESHVDKPKTAELSTFTTDFGVTFGMIICFDILFKSPSIDLVQQKNVTNIIFSTFWFGELPFLTAVQMQFGWSYSMNVNLLASGGNRPEIGTTGSGIYIGRKDRISWMLEKSMDVVIVRGVPITEDKDEFPGVCRAEETSNLTWGLKLKEDPSIPSSTKKDLDLNRNDFQETVCHKEHCCRYSIKYKMRERETSTNYKYRVAAFHGFREFGEGHWHKAAYCALLLCTNGNCAKEPTNADFPLEFNEIRIEANFQANNSFQMPDTLIRRTDLPKYMLYDTMNYEDFSYESKKMESENTVNVSIELKKNKVENLMTFGIFGRIFD